MAHVYGVRDEATVVQRNLDLFRVGRRVEADLESAAVGLEVLSLEGDTGGAGGVALKVRRRVNLVAELGDEGVLRVGGENGLLDGVGARDEEGTVEEEEGDAVVETGDVGLGARGEALTNGLGRVVDQNLEGGRAGNTEALRALLGTVDPDDSAVGEESTLNHTATLGHSLHLPRRVGGLGVDATTGGLARGADILVGSSTADDDVVAPFVGARKRQHDGATGVGVGTVATGQVRKSADDIASTDAEDLSRLRDKDEKVAVAEQVYEGVHVVGLVLGQDLHVDALALGSTIGV